MRIGLANTWANRGQAVRARQMREIFEEAGHETFVLALRLPGTHPIDSIDGRPEWRQPRVTPAASGEPSVGEYLGWARDTGIEVLFTNQNEQFEALAALRRAGVRTIGRFNWEGFGENQAAGVGEAYDVVYSLTRTAQYRYRVLFGLETPYVRYGIHPSLLDRPAARRDDAVWFVFHGGLQGRRKPIAKTIEAFRRVDHPGIRLVVKSQAVKVVSEEVDTGGDPRISHLVEDMERDDYLDLMSGFHVCLNPTRWEGIGMWIFDALGLGLPVVTTDIPPINEFVLHGVNGLLVRPILLGQKKRGVPRCDPDVGHLAEVIGQLADPDRVAELSRSLAADRPRLSWEFTRQDYLALAEGRLG